MTTAETLREIIETRINGFLDTAATDLEAISPELTPLVRHARHLLHGGKRIRPQFCYWGWRACDLGSSGETSRDYLDQIINLATGIEFFQASALIHDDLIDNSDTRRGIPAAHIVFQRLHEQARWAGSASEFGRSSALLLGDLLMSWSERIHGDALAALPDPGRAERCRRILDEMRTDVMLGQYLDLTAEHGWPRARESEALSRVETVMTYKSAKYSIEQPLLLGAAAAGATPVTMQQLSTFGINAGIAFQIRDDILGVFGDPQKTGKPTGGDLIEGKRTLLIALTRNFVTDSAKHIIDDLIGGSALNDDQINMLQNTIRECGALDSAEREVANRVDKATAALETASIDPIAHESLIALARAAATRAA